jgi:hypothetical protein
MGYLYNHSIFLYDGISKAILYSEALFPEFEKVFLESLPATAKKNKYRVDTPV